MEETYRSVRDHRTVMAEHFHRGLHALTCPGSPSRVHPGREPAASCSTFAELRTPVIVQQPAWT